MEDNMCSTSNDDSAFIPMSHGNINNITTMATEQVMLQGSISDTMTAEITEQFLPATTQDTTTASTSAAMSLQPNSSMVVSDDEVQILHITKKESSPMLSIKIDSSDDEGCEIRGVLIIPESEANDCKNISDNIKALGDFKTDEPGSSCSKDPICSICLSEFDNKAFLDQCFHAFCFYCILQWSEIVRTCPLCKALFTKIIHSVKSMTDYQQHKLPPKENPTKNTSINGRRFRYRTTLVNGRQSHNATPSRRPLNKWEQRAQRRERLLAMKRRRSIRAKEKRQSIYARNLWVQTVTQTGRAKYRDTSPQFFRANPACTHRLVPWLTRELQCLLDEEQSHVDFVLQLILALITKITIGSQEFLEQVRPFLLEKTEHFCHEFLSYARSPFDMKAYDERAQYEWTRHSDEQVEQTPMVVDISATGWDSPDEVQSSALVSYSNEPGPSGLSSQQLNGWSPPIIDAIEVSDVHNEIWSDAAEQVTNVVIDLSPEVIDLDNPNQNSHLSKHKRKHKHRHKHKHRKRSRDNEHFETSPIRLSTSPVERNSSVDVVILSSSYDSSPEDPLHSRNSSNNRSDDSYRKLRDKGKHPKQNFHSSETLMSRESSNNRSDDDSYRKSRDKGKHPKQNFHSSETLMSRESSNNRSDDDSCRKSRDKGKHSKQNFHSSETLMSRESSSDRSHDENNQRLRHKGKHSRKRYVRSHEKSSEISPALHKHSGQHRVEIRNGNRSLSPEIDPISMSISNGFSLDTPSSALLTEPSSHTVARPLSPTEDEMRQEILDLERKIDEDTSRLDELNKKQEQRQHEIACGAEASSLYTEDGETDGQSR